MSAQPPLSWGHSSVGHPSAPWGCLLVSWDHPFVPRCHLPALQCHVPAPQGHAPATQATSLFPNAAFLQPDVTFLCPSTISLHPSAITLDARATSLLPGVISLHPTALWTNSLLPSVTSYVPQGRHTCLRASSYSQLLLVVPCLHPSATLFPFSMCPFSAEVPEEPEPPTLDYNEQLEREDYEDCTVLGCGWGATGTPGLQGGIEGMSPPTSHHTASATLCVPSRVHPAAAEAPQAPQQEET